MKRFEFSALLVVAALGMFNPRTASADALLDKIVNPGFLGVTLKYAEHVIGVPAMGERFDRLGFQWNTYERQGCFINLGIKEGKVVTVGTFFRPEKGCDVDVSDIVNQGAVKGSKTRFKDYSWRGPLHFTDPQLPSCNACGEGTFYATIDGVGAMGNVSVQLAADTFGTASNHHAWRNLLRSNGIDGTREDALPLTAENCPLRSFDAKAFALLKDTKVTGIAFSRTPAALQPQCSGKAVWARISRG